jgi:hypothetical protein
MNMETAELLADLRIDDSLLPWQWRHLDGRPIADDEVTAVMGATVDDMRAAAMLTQMRLIDVREQSAALSEMKDLIAPYIAAHPECRLVGEVIATMTDADRARYLELAEQVGLT